MTPKSLEGNNLLILALHGSAESPGQWFGDDGEGNFPIALEAEQVKAADLSGAIVFAVNCDAKESGLVDAFLAAGVACVVGGLGTNYAARDALVGAHLLGWVFVKLLQAGLSVGRALTIAKVLTIWDVSQGGRDSKGFQVWGNANAKLD